MSNRAPTRRSLLSGLAGGLLAVPLAGTARAFTVEPMSPAATELYRAACQARHPGYHDELVAEVVSLLRAEGIETDAAAVRRALTAAACPLCGCTLAELPEARTTLDDPPPRS